MHETYMESAIKLAKISYENGDIPIGAIIVKDGKIIGQGYNRKELLKDATEHAEIMAIRSAMRNIDSYHLEGTDMYVTLEPCPMCAGAIINSRIKNVYIGAKNKRYGACGSYINLLDMEFNHKSNVIFNILEERCSLLISEFFKELRNKK